MGFAFVAVLCLLIHSVVGSCPDGWVSHGASCYHFSHDREDWPNARAVCQMLGGHLAEVNDADENSYLSTKVKSYNGPAFWLGLNDLQKEGEYVWVSSNTHLTSSAFTDWSISQPNNYVEGENCVVFGYNGKWFDDICADLRHYICETAQAETGAVG